MHTLILLTLLFASSIVVCTNMVMVPALPTIREHFQHIPDIFFKIQYLTMLPSLATGVMAPFSGWFVDRVGRTRWLIGMLAIYAVTGLYGLCVESLQQLILPRLILGFAAAGIITASSVLIADYTTPEERSRYFSYQVIAFAVASSLSTYLGGWLVHFSWRMPFSLYAWAIIVLLLVLICVRDVPRPTFPKPLSAFSQKEGCSFTLWQLLTKGPNRFLYCLFIALAFGIVLIYHRFYILVTFILEPALPPEKIALVLGSVNIATVLSCMTYPKVQQFLGFRNCLIVGLALMSLGYMILSLNQAIISVLVGIFILGWGWGFYLPNATVWILSVVPFEFRGRLLGLVCSATFFGQFMSPVFMKIIHKYLEGFQGEFYFLAIILASIALSLFLTNKFLLHFKRLFNLNCTKIE